MFPYRRRIGEHHLRWLVRSGFVAAFISVMLLTPTLASGQAGASSATPRDLTPFARTKTETLLRQQLPCLGCHTLDGNGGKLGPELANVQDRRDATYIARIVMDPQASVPGTLMPHTPMPREWRELIIRYLGGNSTGLDAANAAPENSVRARWIPAGRLSTLASAPAATDFRAEVTGLTRRRFLFLPLATRPVRQCLRDPTTTCTIRSPAAVRS